MPRVHRQVSSWWCAPVVWTSCSAGPAAARNAAVPAAAVSALGLLTKRSRSLLPAGNSSAPLSPASFGRNAVRLSGCGAPSAASALGPSATMAQPRAAAVLSFTARPSCGTSCSARRSGSSSVPSASRAVVYSVAGRSWVFRAITPLCGQSARGTVVRCTSGHAVGWSSASSCSSACSAWKYFEPQRRPHAHVTKLSAETTGAWAMGGAWRLGQGLSVASQRRPRGRACTSTGTGKWLAASAARGPAADQQYDLYSKYSKY
eukprot:COSAG06_NODE_2026_length_7805_cov_4.099014_3_plen_261_part_00